MTRGRRAVVSGLVGLAAGVMSVLAVSGCSFSASGGGATGGAGVSGTPGTSGVGSASAGLGSGGSASVPADLPSGVPLPAQAPVLVTTGGTGSGQKLWTLTYRPSGGAAQAAAAQGDALTEAGYLATLKGADGTGTYVKGRVAVVTVVQGETLVITVTALG